MSQSHDLVHRAVRVLRPGGDFQAIRQALPTDHQRMVAGDGERIGEPLEYTLVQMVDRTGFAMHGLAGADYLAAEGLTDALVPKADAKNRQLACEVLQHRDGHPRL